ncbi:hypothetical protein EIP86_005244 [Pleurotus ostreatoroseus]|nr:hypothetical protein EIP86_005244 [Pleurotus ostreatoroseus]
MIEGNVLSVHRCRFVDYTPSAVTALAFPPLPLPSAKGKGVVVKKALKFGTLAIGRANGNIELCEWSGSEQELQAPQAWVVRKTIAGPYPSKVDSLAFTLRNSDLLPADETPKFADLRLFSAGGGSELAEWDLERSCIRRTIPSQGGSIWCISPNPASTILAIGCEDGAVRLLSLEHDTLTHLRRLDRVKSRILSLAWGPPVPRETKNTEGSDDEEEEEWSDSWVVAGCSDSSLRKWDLATGRVGDKMGTDKMRGERTLVWAVGVLGDGTIVSGDSLGMVKFWDSKTSTQLHSFQAHGADVLCMTISPEGTAIYTSGVDQKVVQFTHIKTSQSSTQSSLLSRSSGRWVQTSSRRMHSHDVRALAIWPPHTALPPAHRRVLPLDVAPVLASGGLDMSVVLTPAALPASTAVAKVVNPLATSVVSTFEDAYHRRLAYTSAPYHASGLHLARKARLVLCMRDAGVSLWRVHRRRTMFFNTDDPDEEPPADGGWEQVLDMDLSVHTNLVASAISDDGRWIAVSDWYESRLFRIEELENGNLKPKRIRDFTSILQAHLPSSQPSTGASCFIFSPDNTKLIMASTTTSYVLVVDLSDTPRVLRRFDQHRMRNVVLSDRVVRGRTKSAETETEDVEMADAETPAAGEGEKPPPDTADPSDDEDLSQKPLSATITRMAVSPDGQWLATTDDHRRTHIFNLDAVAYHCVLPSFPQPVHALAFDTHAPSTLVLGLADNTLQVYDVEARTFPAWSRVLANALPPRFKGLHDPVLGAAFDAAPAPATERSVLFWGAAWLCRVKLDAGTEYGGFEKKRRWGGRALQVRPPQGVGVTGSNAVTLGEEPKIVPQQNFKLVTHYRPLLFVDFIGPGELVVVERPLVDVLAQMPPAFFKPKYGTT